MWVIGIGILGILVAILIFLRSDLVFTSIHHVPDGTNWKSYYRKMKAEKIKRRGPVVWVVMGGGLGLLVIGIILLVVG